MLCNLFCADGRNSLTSASAQTISTPPEVVASDFEKGKIDKIWKTDKIATGAAKIQSEIVHTGKFAIQMSLQQGQIQGTGANGIKTERTELKEKSKHNITSGRFYEYSFSFYLPKNFPIKNRRLVIGQWKQKGKRSPVLAQRFKNGVFYITSDSEGFSTKTLYKKKVDLEKFLGNWHEVRYRVRFSKDKHGLLEAYLNGSKIVNYKGVLGNRSDPDAFYFKFGLYRDEMQEPMTIYFDSYRRQEIFQ